MGSELSQVWDNSQEMPKECFELPETETSEMMAGSQVILGFLVVASCAREVSCSRWNPPTFLQQIPPDWTLILHNQ